MAGATFSRIKNWVAEKLTNTDLNAEIDNILNNLGPAGVDDYSVNVAQMQSTSDPGEVGTENLAASLATEIEHLRHQLKTITGKTHWYEAPDESLESLSTAVGDQLLPNRIESGRMRTGSSQPIYLVPHGAARTVTVKGATVDFNYFIAGAAYTIDSDEALENLTLAPSSNNTCLVNDASLDGSEMTKYIGEYGTSLTVDAAGSEITSRVGQLAAFKVGAEYFTARIKSSTELSEVRRGFFFDENDAPVPRAAVSDNDTITLLRLTFVFARTDGSLIATYNEPVFSGTEPTSPSSGDYWFDTDNNLWKRFDGFTFTAAAATFIGYCAQDDTNTIAARSADFGRAFSATSTVSIAKFDATQARARDVGSKVSIYGTTVSFGSYLPRWDLDDHLDTGLTEAASMLYFLYITEGGSTVISNLAPHDRRNDLFGFYHPFHAWRCIGQFHNDASSNVEAVISYDDTREDNFAVTHAVASSALTVKLHAPPISSLRARSGTNGVWTSGTILPGTALVISSGSTLGTADATAATLFAHAVIKDGRVELAASQSAYSARGKVTTTAEGGAGAADSGLILYAKAAFTDVPLLPLAVLTSTQTTAGTWAAVLSLIRNIPFNAGTNDFSLVLTSGDVIVPEGKSRAFVEILGGGGGGGGGGSGNSSGTGASGGGGGGGSQKVLATFPVIPGDTLTVSVGGGGSGGAAGSAGSAGTESYIDDSGAVRLVRARGGAAGSGGAQGLGASGGAGGTGTLTDGVILIAGGAGGAAGTGGAAGAVGTAGSRNIYAIASTAGAAGTSGGGNSGGGGGGGGAGTGVGGTGGRGGNHSLAGSPGTGAVGTAGSGYGAGGGGGGGGGGDTSTARAGGAGGAGSAGYAIIYWH